MKSVSTARALTLAAALLALSACGDDDPTNPSGSQGPAFDVTLTATQLIVQEDCDAMTGSASAAAGDFFIRVEMRSVTGATTEVIGSTDYQLIQGVFRAAAGARLELDVSIYENDTSGRQFDETDTVTLVYDAGESCWVYEGDSTCLGGTGGILSNILRYRGGASGDPCSLDLRWTMDATER